jgi:rhodanese-related sulfurtransferase
MAAEGMDLPDLLSVWIVVAPEEANLAAFLSGYDIFDIRSAADFGTSHIEGAKNVPLANVVDEAGVATKPILVVCASGQTAGHAVMALRLSGYNDAVVLKWGMCGWNNATAASWKNSIGNIGIGHDNWENTPGNISAPETFATPVISTSATTGASILAEQVTKMLTSGFKGINNDAVLGSPTTYYINNYWASTDVEQYGNISSAFRINPLSIAGGTFVNLDANNQVITYCWSGQTSSMVTSWLTVLGYNTASLKYGANGMIYEDLEGHMYVAPATNLPLVQ